MEIYNTFCPLLGDKFGRFYEATIERIEGANTPVSWNGSDYTVLHPKDNVDSFCYIRSTAPADINTVDVGGTDLVPIVSNKMRAVFYSSKPFNNFTVLQKFTQSITGLKNEITSFSNTIEQVYSAEIGGRKNMQAKNIGYMYIDFTVTEIVSLCNIESC